MIGMKPDTAKFRVSLDKWAAKVKGQQRRFAIIAIQDLSQAVVEATPVITGFLRASWYASLNGPGAGAGASTVATINLVASQIELGDKFYMMNGAVYARRVEYGFVGTDVLGRTYNQTGRAFVRGTLARADRIFASAAMRVQAA